MPKHNADSTQSRERYSDDVAHRLRRMRESFANGQPLLDADLATAWEHIANLSEDVRTLVLHNRADNAPLCNHCDEPWPCRPTETIVGHWLNGVYGRGQSDE